MKRNIWTNLSERQIRRKEDLIIFILRFKGTSVERVMINSI